MINVSIVENPNQQQYFGINEVLNNPGKIYRRDNYYYTSVVFNKNGNLSKLIVCLTNSSVIIADPSNFDSINDFEETNATVNIEVQV